MKSLILHQALLIATLTSISAQGEIPPQKASTSKLRLAGLLLCAPLILFLASCAAEPKKSYPGLGAGATDPLVAHPLVTLQDRIKPRDKYDLRELLLTFNIGDIAPEDSRQYVYENAILRFNEIELLADGGASPMALKKLPKLNHYEYRDGWPGAIGTTISTLKRTNLRWIVLDKKTLTTGIKMAGEGPA